MTEAPIVCGTDFSVTATEAVDTAAAMARRLETTLVLVHADQLYRSLVPLIQLLIEAAISKRRGELNSEAQRLRDLGTQGRREISFWVGALRIGDGRDEIQKLDSLWSGRSGTVSRDDYSSGA